jgi:transketolase
VSYEETLHRIALEDPRVLVLTAENRAPVRGLPSRLGARFIDVGIAEQTLVGVAAGLALAGRVPVVHALAPFLTMRAFEFIRTDVGIGGLPVKLIGFIPGVLSDGNGPTHQSLEDIGLMRSIPGMQVFCPADADELTRALPALVAAQGPCYVRYTSLPRETDAQQPVLPGRAELCARGEDVTLLAFGALLSRAAQARAALEAQGLSAGLLNVRWLAPLDEPAIARAALESRALVTIEDHFTSSGLYPAVTEILHRRRIPTRVIPIGFERWFAAGRYEDVLEHAGLSGPRLAARISAALAQKES